MAILFFILLLTPISVGADSGLRSQYDAIFQRAYEGHSDQKAPLGASSAGLKSLKMGQIHLHLVLTLHPLMQSFLADSGTFLRDSMLEKSPKERKRLHEAASRRARSMRSRLAKIRQDLRNAKAALARLEYDFSRRTQNGSDALDEQSFWEERAQHSQKIQKLQNELGGDFAQRVYGDLYLSHEEARKRFAKIHREVLNLVREFREKSGLALVFQARTPRLERLLDTQEGDILRQGPDQLKRFVSQDFFLGDQHAAVSDSGLVNMLKGWLNQREDWLEGSLGGMQILSSDATDITLDVLKELYQRYGYEDSAARRVLRAVKSLIQEVR